MENKAKLNQIREEIDATDQQLVSLLKHRMQLSRQIAEVKKAGGIAVHDQAREEAILKQVSGQAGPDFENDIRTLYSKIFSLSKARQRACLFQRQEHPLKTEIQKALAHSGPFPHHATVACPGMEGSYSQQAVYRMFSHPSIQYFPTFESVFEAVEQGLCPYGILPIEKPEGSSLFPAYETLIRHHCHIVRSCRLPIQHVLLGKNDVTEKDIRQVASQPQALVQCSRFLKQHPNWNLCLSDNAASAAKELAEAGDITQAVIASPACAKLYGLNILAENLTDSPQNCTRFLCISRALEIFENAKKFSLMLELPHRPGALCDLLNRFAGLGINLTKLKSRSIPDSDFQVPFILDFEAFPEAPQPLQLLDELTSDPQITHFTLLGIYDEN